MSFGSKSSSPTTSTTVQSSEPWSGVKPFLEQAYGDMSKTYQNADKSYYTGQMKADENASQRQGLLTQQALFQNAQDTGFGDAFMQMANDTASGKYLTLDSNPNFQGAVDSILRPINQNFTEQVLPALRDTAINSGYYGGTRQGVAQGIAARELNNTITDKVAKLGYQNYATERQNQLAAGDLLKQGLLTQALPSDLLITTGEGLQALDQAKIDNQIAQDQYNSIAPYAPYSNYISMLQGAGTTTTGTTTSSGTKSNSILNALQGGAGGAMLAKTLMTSANPWNLASYGILGALGGGLFG